MDKNTTIELKPADYVLFCDLLEKAGIAPAGATAKAKASYPMGYDGPVVSIGVSASMLAKAAELERRGCWHGFREERPIDAINDAVCDAAAEGRYATQDEIAQAARGENW